MSMATPTPSSSRARPWADLPTELVEAVVARLDVFSAARLAAVRAPWARAAVAATSAWSSSSSLPFGKPCLLLSREEDYGYASDDEDSDCIYDLLDLGAGDEAAPTAALLRPLRGRWWVGGRGNWLATVDELCDARLVNPYTGDRVDLPAFATIPDIVVCDTPSPPATAGNDGGYLVVAIVTSRVLAFARGGDRSWTALTNHRDMWIGYDDAIVHGGKVFAVDCIGNLFAWDLRGGPGGEPEHVPTPRADYSGSVYQWNLAESADGRRLLLACTHGRHVGDGETSSYEFFTQMVKRRFHFHADGVRLHELDVDDAAGTVGWRRVTGLGDRALFLGANWPLWVSVRRGSPEQLVRPNCVYVAPGVLFGYPDEDFDVVRYDLGDRSCRQIKLSYADRHGGFYLPIWFRPALQKWCHAEEAGVPCGMH
ncbi:hypothetical protein ACP70R_041746 [Stipagrostis hirtigluma subsp. patula]